MDGLYQDLIIMAIIFVTGVWCINAYYQLKGKFDELVTDFHRLAEGRDYVEDIDVQAYAQGRENGYHVSINDINKMQHDIIDLQQKCINLNAKIKNENVITAMSRT
jgi:hypothetical protein